MNFQISKSKSKPTPINYFNFIYCTSINSKPREKTKSLFLSFLGSPEHVCAVCLAQGDWWGTGKLHCISARSLFLKLFKTWVLKKREFVLLKRTNRWECLGPLTTLELSHVSDLGGAEWGQSPAPGPGPASRLSWSSSPSWERGQGQGQYFFIIW